MLSPVPFASAVCCFDGMGGSNLPQFDTRSVYFLHVIHTDVIDSVFDKQFSTSFSLKLFTIELDVLQLLRFGWAYVGLHLSGVANEVVNFSISVFVEISKKCEGNRVC